MSDLKRLAAALLHMVEESHDLNNIYNAKGEILMSMEAAKAKLADPEKTPCCGIDYTTSVDVTIYDGDKEKMVMNEIYPEDGRQLEDMPVRKWCSGCYDFHPLTREETYELIEQAGLDRPS